MTDTLDMDRIANALGAERRGKVSTRGGYFGALQLADEVAKQTQARPIQVAALLLEQAVQTVVEPG